MIPEPAGSATWLGLGENAESAANDTETHGTGGDDGQSVEGPSLASSVLGAGRGASRGARGTAGGGSGRAGLDRVGHVGGESRRYRRDETHVSWIVDSYPMQDVNDVQAKFDPHFWSMARPTALPEKVPLLFSEATW